MSTWMLIFESANPKVERVPVIEKSPIFYMMQFSVSYFKLVSSDVVHKIRLSQRMKRKLFITRDPINLVVHWSGRRKRRIFKICYLICQGIEKRESVHAFKVAVGFFPIWYWISFDLPRDFDWKKDASASVFLNF